MKTEKITSAQVKILADLQSARNAKNAAIKAEKELLAIAKNEIPSLESGEIALIFNSQVIATQQVSTRKAVSVELLKQTYPKIADEMTTETTVSTLRVMV